MRRAAFLAALLAIPLAAKAAPLDAFVAAFGEDGLKTLSDRGYVVLQGRGNERRLAAVHWKALEGLADAATSCVALAKGAAGVAACRALPDDGAVTPRVHALAAAVAAASDERASLASAGAPMNEPAGLPNLFETAWGKELAARLRADRLEDHSFLAKPYFEEFLAGPKPNPAAVAHFLAVEKASGANGAEAALKAGAAHGAADDSLRMTIGRYLQDESRRRGLTLAADRVDKLLADKPTRKELDALAGLAGALAAKPGLLSSLEAAVSGAPAPKGVPLLRSAGIHLQEPVRLGQYELGDEAVVSGAYWVDGLPEGGSAEIEETTFLETARGFLSVETHVVKRRDGGPYPYERRVAIAESRPFAVVALISAASGTIVAERAEVPFAPDFELALKKEAAALESLQSCDPKSAEATYAELEGLLPDAAKVKPQYKALLERARKGRAAASAESASLAKLEEAVADARADSSPQQCRYDLSRTDAAVKLARKLPPGCDRVLPELFAQRALISRRAVDQSWFLKASSEARSRRRSCDFAAASARWTEALAVLEADPAARCGKAAEEAKAAEAALSETRLAQVWNESLEKSVAAAEAQPVPAKRLALLAPVLARLSALPDQDCRRSLFKRAESLSDKAAAEESGPAVAAAAARLPADSTLAAIIEDVRRARSRSMEKTAATFDPDVTPPPAKAKR
ncbi:MAG: hypothetical protein KGJ84_00785 [Elusimicrobia bacterium]|nr:hypothetical protein [Elusimicrobiota bacterium]